MKEEERVREREKREGKRDGGQQRKGEEGGGRESETVRECYEKKRKETNERQGGAEGGVVGGRRIENEGWTMGTRQGRDSQTVRNRFQNRCSLGSLSGWRTSYSTRASRGRQLGFGYERGEAARREEREESALSPAVHETNVDALARPTRVRLVDVDGPFKFFPHSISIATMLDVLVPIRQPLPVRSFRLTVENSTSRDTVGRRRRRSFDDPSVVQHFPTISFVLAANCHTPRRHPRRGDSDFARSSASSSIEAKICDI